MKQGNLFDGTDDYELFCRKFEPKKTTDDCYTPPMVYDACADWVASEYGVKRENFVRPFYPDNDYKEMEYRPEDIVVDNPPFSIISEIIRHYLSEGVRFFLFGPHLTLFSGQAIKCTCIPIGVCITYENGARVNTSFVTNLDNPDIVARTAPGLYAAIKKADEENQRQTKKQLPTYIYPKNVIMTPTFHRLSRNGIDFKVERADCAQIEKLDAQRVVGKAIFGKGLLLSDFKAAEREAAEREAAEREAAEREAAEREAAERWELSERERFIVEHLNKRHDEARRADT